MKLLTIEETAAILRLSPCTVTRLCRKKAIPAKKIGGSWRIDEEGLRKWVGGGLMGTVKLK